MAGLAILGVIAAIILVHFGVAFYFKLKRKFQIGKMSDADFASLVSSYPDQEQCFLIIEMLEWDNYPLPSKEAFLSFLERSKRGSMELIAVLWLMSLKLGCCNELLDVYPGAKTDYDQFVGMMQRYYRRFGRNRN